MRRTEMINLFAFTGSLLSTGMVGVMYWTFLTAYFSPDKATLVTVNSLGEANWEIVALGLVVLISVFASGVAFYRTITNRD